VPIGNADAAALVTDPIQVFILLVLIVCGSIWLLSRPALASLGRVLPAPIWIYILPVTLTSVGILPADNPAYTTMAMILVPTSLFLLTVSSDFRSTFKIGHMATIMLAAGTSGILLGGFFAFVSIQSGLPEEGWKGFAVLSGAWIGGSANAVAVQQGIDADPAIIGPLLIVDSLLGYGWVALLLFLAGQQTRLARLFRYDPQRGIDLDAVTVERMDKTPVTSVGLSKVLGVAFLFSAIAAMVGDLLPELGDPTIVSATTWTILIIVALGVASSFTPLRRLDADGASDVGFVLILLLLSSLGARGDLRAFLDAPIYLLSGVIWLFTHLVILGVVARLVKAPPVLFALGSVANIGGFVTAPIIATAYNRNLVPTALLMAAIAQIAGIYLPFAFASLLASLAQ